MHSDQQLLKELDEVQLLFNSQAIDLALKKISKIIKRHDKQYLPYNYRGIILLATQKYDLALADFIKSVSLHKEFSEGYCNIGNAYQALGAYDKSLEAYMRAKKLEKNNLQVQVNVGTLYFKMGEYQLAIGAYKEFLALNKDVEYVHQLIAEAYAQESKHDQSLASHEEALRINPTNHLNYFFIGRDYLWAGKEELAIEYIEKSIEINPEHCPSYYALSKLRKINLKEEITGKIYALLDQDSLSSLEKAYLNFALAKVHNDENDNDEFFKYLKIANKCMKDHNQFNFKSFENEVIESINFFNAKASQVNISDRHTDKSLCPIFIVGMPRSGSTLVEQIISNDPKVFGAGELDTIHLSMSGLLKEKNLNQATIENYFFRLRKKYLDRLTNITNKNYIVDKLPLNFLWIGYIKMLFPNAKIIHTYRDPIATSFSIYKTLFTEGSLNFAYDEDDIIAFYKMYSRFMSFWSEKFKDSILNVNYDNLVLDSENESKKIFDYIGIEYSNECLNLEKNTRSIMTASDLQARGKIYTGSSNVWQKYKDHLGKFTGAFKS